MMAMQSHFKRYGWGVLLALAVALAANQLSAIPAIAGAGLSALTLAIVIGMIIGNTVFPKFAVSCAAGIDFSKTRLLRLGIILYGFRITYQQIGAIGVRGIVIDILIISLTFGIAVWLGTRVFKLDRETSMLIGAGSAICGAAAVLATEPVVKGQAHKVSVAVATVVIFGTLGMFLYPVLYPYLNLSEAAYGIYVGSTLHEVAQVVVAGKAVGDVAASTAVIEKMLRVMMLAPFLLILSSRMGVGEASQTDSRKITIPWFAVMFIVVAGINSLQILPQQLVDWIVKLDTLLLAMAMAALGIRTHLAAVRQAGPRPILLATVLFAFLIVGGYFINHAVTALI
jgi:uncharacterized integral membrane protein (TIGR00698 family)